MSWFQKIIEWLTSWFRKPKPVKVHVSYAGSSSAFAGDDVGFAGRGE